MIGQIPVTVAGRARRAAPLAALAAALALAANWTAPPPELGPTLEGPCSVQATVTGSSEVVDPSRSGGVYVVPARGVVAYDAALAGVAAQDAGRRDISGHVELDLPPPLPSLRLASWDEVGTTPVEQGSRPYRIPDLVAPVGATVTVRALHRDAATAGTTGPSGQSVLGDGSGVRCLGSLSLRIGGDPFDNPIRALVVAWTVASAALLAWTGEPKEPTSGRPDPWRTRTPAHSSRGGAPVPWWHPQGRLLWGGVAGVAFGIGLALMVLLSGTVALESSLISVIVALGVAAGLFVGWFGPTDVPRRRRATGGEDVELEVVVLGTHPPPR